LGRAAVEAEVKAEGVASVKRGERSVAERAASTEGGVEKRIFRRKLDFSTAPG
jgi:hypothetical protein